jgi:hypothetical protein|tara:strand:- start:1358 stop:1555 length:198 start_codon:yes stop_codon:yes gene_type:complete
MKMKMSELLKSLEMVGDDDQIFVVTSQYDPDDDCTWIAENQPDIKKVVVDEYNDVFIVIDCETCD